MAQSIRESIGSHIAYDIDWSKIFRGRLQYVMHAGGTIGITLKDGREYRITVEQRGNSGG
jgi:hypothetical protein